MLYPHSLKSLILFKRYITSYLVTSIPPLSDKISLIASIALITTRGSASFVNLYKVSRKSVSIKLKYFKLTFKFTLRKMVEFDTSYNCSLFNIGVNIIQTLLDCLLHIISYSFKSKRAQTSQSKTSYLVVESVIAIL